MRRRGFTLGGNLLTFADTGIVPLWIYTVERLTGLWPDGGADAYAEFYQAVDPAWVVMELGAIGVYGYVCYLAGDIFHGALGFTFGLALAGLVILLCERAQHGSVAAKNHSLTSRGDFASWSARHRSLALVVCRFRSRRSSVARGNSLPSAIFCAVLMSGW